MTTDSTTAPQVRASDFEAALSQYVYARDHLNSLGSDVTLATENLASAAFGAADDALTMTPANSLSDLRAKMELLWADPASTPRREHRLAFFADLRRLTGDAPSRLFNAKSWLKWFERRGGMYCCRDGEVFLLRPDGTDLSDPMFELEATGGVDAVKQLIRERCAVQEAAR